MPRGHPDWQVNTSQFAFGDIDTAEIAARIGSPNVIFRGGRVLYLTGFENDLNDWVPNNPSGAADIRASRFAGDGLSSGKRPLRGSGCLKMWAEATAGADGRMREQCLKLLPAVWNGNLAIEANMAPGENAQEIGFRIAFNGDGITREAEISFDVVNKHAHYRSTVGDWAAAKFTEFADLPLGQWYPPALVSLRWANVKLVLSSALDEYLGVYLNGKLLGDLSGIAIPTGAYAATAFEALSPSVTVIDDDGTAGELYVDDVIVTHDEPWAT